MEEPLASIRLRRDELYEALLALERAVGAPARGRAGTWAATVRERLAALRDALQAHIAATEAEDGLFAQVLDREPRLAHGVERLRADHVSALDAVGVADVELAPTDVFDEARAEAIRSHLHDLIHSLFLHRSRGAELVYEAYDVDLSAGD